MHDNSPGGLAVKDRALAFWTDDNNFQDDEDIRDFGVGMLMGWFFG